MFRKRFFVIFCFFFISSSLIECQDDGEITPTSGAEANEIQQNPKEVFLELIRQRFNGNAVQQCPCVTPPGTDKCIIYDPRYAAVSPEEAAVAFTDLTADNFDTSPFRRSDYNCSSEQCIQCSALLFYRLKEINFIPANYASRFNFDLPRLQELRPQGCKRLWMTRRRHLLAPPLTTPDYVRRLIEQGSRYVNDYSRFPSTDYSSKVTETLTLQNGPQYSSPSNGPQSPPIAQQPFFQPIGQMGSFGPNGLGPNASPSFPGFPGPSLFSQFPPVQQPLQPPLFPPSAPPSYYFPPISGSGSGVGAGAVGAGAIGTGAAGVGAGGAGLDAAASRFPPGMLAGLVAEKAAFLSLFGKKRRKRNTHDVSGKNLVGERFVISCVEKGDAESDETDFLNLCTSCWAWRKLPDNYFPQIINELVCQENDFCLSGWGSCTQRYRHVDVLHRQNGTWVPTTVVSGACCDCKIRAGTEVHQLVIGNTQREYRQVDSVFDRALRATVDRNNPPNMDSIDSNPIQSTDSSSPETTSSSPSGELKIRKIL